MRKQLDKFFARLGYIPTPKPVPCLKDKTTPYDIHILNKRVIINAYKMEMAVDPSAKLKAIKEQMVSEILQEAESFLEWYNEGPSPVGLEQRLEVQLIVAKRKTDKIQMPPLVEVRNF